tara:strand:+ start:138 stop:374 length:237 start_codon:yes stop_codon:yes gene_type:complete
MVEEAFEYMIVLDDGQTFGYLEGARVLKVPRRLTCNSEAPELPAPEELQEYIEENLKYADPLNVVEDDGCDMIIQRID